MTEQGRLQPLGHRKGHADSAARDLGPSQPEPHKARPTNVKPRTSVPWQSVLAIATALGYGISPLDFIPDLIPIFGVLDDGVVIVIMVVIAVLQYKKAKAKASEPPVIDATIVR